MLYVVIKKGVYRHNVIGVWDNLANAKKAAEGAIASEPDDYHQMEIVRTPLNLIGEDEVVATLYREIENPARREPANKVKKQWWEETS